MVSLRLSLPTLLLAGALAGAALCAPAPARAQEILGPRSQGMGSIHRGVGTSNDALFTNVAGMSLFPRYAAEIFWTRDFKAAESVVSISTVDSRSGPVAGGIAYSYRYRGASGEARAGGQIDIGASYRLAEFIMLGSTVRYIAVETDEGTVNQVTGDTGLMINLFNLIFLGFTGHNVVNPADTDLIAPRAFGTGVSLFMGQLQIGLDYLVTPEVSNSPNRYHAGIEYFAMGAFALRAGWSLDELHDTHRVSAGLGYVTRTFALDLSYAQGLDPAAPDQHLGLGIRLFL